MTTTKLVMLSGAIEAATGIALLAAPDLVARILLGAELSGSGVAVARVAGFGLLALGLACWPGKTDAAPSSTRALFVYNILAGLYLGYLRASGSFLSPILWLACALHVVLGLLLARPAFTQVPRE